MPWLTIASGAMSLIGGAMNSSAAGDAADAGRAGAEASQRMNDARYKEIQGMVAPYQSQGLRANDRLSMLMGLGQSKRRFKDPLAQSAVERLMNDPVNRISPDYETTVDQVAAGWGQTPETVSNETDPNFGLLSRQFNEADLASDVPYNKGLQFGLDQGTGAINSRAIQNGGYDSGATLKALTRFANDYGSQKAGEAQQRFTGFQNQQYGQLSGQQGVGMNATNTLANAGMATTASNVGLEGDKANATAAGVVGQANAASDAFGGISSAIKGYQNNQIYDRILKGGRTSYDSGNGWY